MVWMLWMGWLQEWNCIHDANFKCTIATQLRSFYCQLFHKVIGTNQFPHKTGRNDSTSCCFCNNLQETTLHLFCECGKSFHPLGWIMFLFLFVFSFFFSLFLSNVSGESFTFSNFEKTNVWCHRSLWTWQLFSFLLFMLAILSSQMQISANQSKMLFHL